ncbi:MAG: heterocyst development glycosyltransferase HepC [Cyanobacteria bacterium J06581_3]
MPASTVLLKTPVVFHFPSNDSNSSAFENCRLTWDQSLLIVTSVRCGTETIMPALKDEDWLQDCLRNSSVRDVYLDPLLEESVLKTWACLCRKTGKQVYLTVPSIPYLPQVRQPFFWRVKRLADWLVAGVLLVVLSPLMLLLAVLIRLDSKGPVLFRQWRVGGQGQLFQICKFRSMRAGAEMQHHEVMGNQVGLHKLQEDPRVTRVGRWLRKLSLDELPQLLNVLWAEMSLVGPRPWAIYDAVRIRPELQQRLHVLPGITGPWQVSTRSTELDLCTVTRRDLSYLRNWSLLRDLNILFLTIPKALFGSGAY